MKITFTIIGAGFVGLSAAQGLQSLSNLQHFGEKAA
jgi:2-polyprenyl-6-methoxyphenol hydroxylase-like FAD-dependent oxidoreductase